MCIRDRPPKAEKPPRQERKSAEAPAPAPEEKTRQSAPVQTLGEEVDDEKAQAIRKSVSYTHLPENTDRNRYFTARIPSSKASSAAAHRISGSHLRRPL